jgi:hypothetical protein
MAVGISDRKSGRFNSTLFQPEILKPIKIFALISPPFAG